MILLVSATAPEIQPAIDFVEKGVSRENCRVLISGVGIPSTMYRLQHFIAHHGVSLVIQAGIAGAFNRSLELGEVVRVETEQWSDLGIEDHDDFRSVFQIGFTQMDEPPYSSGKINLSSDADSLLNHLKKVNGVTSNLAHGNQSSINMVAGTFNPDIETMEGAAAAYVCAMENIPEVQLRAISNYVEPRDRSKWNIPLAVSNLNDELIAFLRKI